MMTYDVASFFSGIGGIDLGFESTGRYRTVYADEISSPPRHIMQVNFTDIEIDPRDIRSVQSDDVPDADVIVGGFPCQSFSMVGARRGMSDAKNGDLFFHVMRIVKAKLPRAVMLENVPGILTSDGGMMIRAIEGVFDDIGYRLTYQVMQACEHGGVPQSRPRVIFVAFRDDADSARFSFPSEIPMTPIEDVVDFYDTDLMEALDATHDYSPSWKPEKLAQLDVIADSIGRGRFVATNARGRVGIARGGSVSPCVTAVNATRGRNSLVVRTPDRVRFISVGECLKLQGFPDDFIVPADVSDTAIRKGAGNAVCVPMIRRVADAIADAMEGR